MDKLLNKLSDMFIGIAATARKHYVSHILKWMDPEKYGKELIRRLEMAKRELDNLEKNNQDVVKSKWLNTTKELLQEVRREREHWIQTSNCEALESLYSNVFVNFVLYSYELFNPPVDAQVGEAQTAKKIEQIPKESAGQPKARIIDSAEAKGSQISRSFTEIPRRSTDQVYQVPTDIGTSKLVPIQRCIEQSKATSGEPKETEEPQIAKEVAFTADELKKISDARNLIGKVEGYDLDDQQMYCVCTDAHNQLVIAGAGTGKTTTIIGKIKYLLITGECRPKDILVLSYTKASASELSQRINQQTGKKIKALTFHALGLRIIMKVEASNPHPRDLQNAFIQDRVMECMQNPGYLRLLWEYCLSNKPGDNLDLSVVKNYGQQIMQGNTANLPKLSPEDVARIQLKNEVIIDRFIGLCNTVIGLIKINDYDIETVRKFNKLKGGSNERTNDIIISLVEPIYNAYQRELQETGDIDFNDMINKAAHYIREGRYKNSYRYVIVDEYQDISKARCNLLKALRESNDFKLICVGDDWQSIYGFSGSDVGYILNFKEYWGPSLVSHISNTYRFPQSLVDISGDFVMQNFDQIKKTIRGRPGSGDFAVTELCGKNEKELVEHIARKLEGIPKGKSVYLIGRYSSDINILRKFGYFKMTGTSGVIDVKYTPRPDLKIQFLTAHKSKGLQADIVFVLNNLDAYKGFPTKIENAPILNLLLEHTDVFPYAEERRLFYVALTRAKEKVYLLTQKGKESVFVKDLRNRYGSMLKEDKERCPRCGATLALIEETDMQFYLCENFYGEKKCRYTKNIWMAPSEYLNSDTQSM